MLKEKLEGVGFEEDVFPDVNIEAGVLLVWDDAEGPEPKLGGLNNDGLAGGGANDAGDWETKGEDDAT